MDDIEVLNSSSNAIMSALEVVLGIIDYKNKPKQQDRLKKFYIKLKLANTHKKKTDLAYIMLAMLSDLEGKQLLNVVEKNKIANAVKLSKDKKFRDRLISFIKKERQDKVKVAMRFLSEFLNLEVRISKTNSINRNKKDTPKVQEPVQEPVVEPVVEEPKVIAVKHPAKPVKEEYLVGSLLVEPEEEVKEEPKVELQEELIDTSEIKEIEIPGTIEDVMEETDTLILPPVEEMDKLLDTKVLPKINLDDMKPVIPTKEDVIPKEPLKEVNELMEDILSKTYSPEEEKKVTRTKEEVIHGIEEYINNNYKTISYNHAIPYEDMEELRVLFPELRSYKSPYYNLDTIANLIETSCIIKSVRENNYIDIETLMNLAINAHGLVLRRILTYDLEKKDDEYKDARTLISYINLENPIKVYEEAYNIFFNYYRSLSKEEQREICVSIERKMPYEYKSLFNIPDTIPYEIDTVVNNVKLKATINDTVKHEILVNHGIRFDDLDNKEVPALLAYATIYMDDKNVVSMYRSLEEKNERAYKELKNRSEFITKEQYDELIKKSSKLQEWFASAITINRSREDSKLRNDIKNPELLQEHLIYITKNVLKEEPLFTRSSSHARIKLDDTEVKDFYNSTRLKKTQVRVFNHWNKLPKLIILNGYDSDVKKSKKVG